jgi:RNA polymerase sigma factor (sigma-70 family)
MEAALSSVVMTDEQNYRIAEAVAREQSRLRKFIRKRMPYESEAEDILQDVFYALVEAHRLMTPVEQVGAWLFQVARNRIIDRFCKRKPEGARNIVRAGKKAADPFPLEDLLPSPDVSPEAAYVREVLLAEIHAALDELPEEQREAFVAHEFEGRTCKELATETGARVNTLLSRKHYAVPHLRRRLRTIYDTFKKG